jgi:membrane associated rhomboid family serine protease
MAKECNFCGFRDPMPFACKFCGESYCYNHRLPESHNCPGLAVYKERIRREGKFYHSEPVLVRKTRKPLFGNLNKGLSIITGNYSLLILVIAIISFFLQYIFGYDLYFSYFALSPSDIFHQPLKFILNLVTHMFLHGGPTHLLFNMMFLFFIGPELERIIGGKKFLIVFFLTGIIGGIGYLLWSLFTFYIFNTQLIPAVGASGALFGIFACLAIIAPYINVYVFFIPVPMKIIHSMIFFTLLDIIFIGMGEPIALSAHLSGAIAGFILGKFIKNSGQYNRY